MGLISEYREVTRLLQEKQAVVFYAESRHYYQYFETLINELTEKRGIQICYITSDKEDPVLKGQSSGIMAVYCKWMLGFLFKRIRADVMVLTITDLGNYVISRSPLVGEYVYMFHAAVSTHLQYTKTAFLNYDSVFCTGDFQLKELQKAEALYAAKQKSFISYGYPLLEVLSGAEKTTGSTSTILIAPSWFEGCIFETCLEELLQQLAVLPYRVIVRSHPEYEKRYPKKFRRIRELVRSYANMEIDELPNVMDRLPGTNILITDRSGIAFEFALGVKRPVLFIETGLKLTNPDWEELGIEPLENSCRAELGISIAPDQLSRLPEKLKELEEFSIGFGQRAEELKRKHFFNPEDGRRSGTEYILSKLTNE